MKSGEIFEDWKGRDKAGCQIRSKVQVPHKEGRRVGLTVEEVVGGVRFPTYACRERRIYRWVQSIFVGVQVFAVP